MARLTDTAVRALPLPDQGQKTYWDSDLTGFGCRVSQGGTRSFVLQFGVNRQLVTIGRYHPEILPLAKARAEAKRLLAESTLGRHRPHKITFKDAKDQFLAECQRKNKPRTVYDYTRILHRHFALGKEQLAEITTAELSKRLGKITAKAERNYATVVGKVFFNWCYRQGYIELSPAGRLETAPSNVRKRVLTDEELAKVLKLASKSRSKFELIVLVLALTGQRRGEIAALERAWMTDNLITLPGRLTKNHLEHTFPIGRMTHDILKSIPETDPYYFPAAHKRSEKTTIFSGWSKPKAIFDAKLKIAPWTLHDLRRTLRSKWAALGISKAVAEKYINHISGEQAGVAGVYDQYDYMSEMKAAVKVWESYLQKLLKT